MSTHLFPVMEATKQAGTPLAILLAIAAHADQSTGIAYPGNERLAELCNVKIRTVQRTIQKLADDGDITILEDGNGRGNKRVMLVNAIRKGDTHDTLSHQKGDTDDTVSSDKKGDIDGVKGDTHDKKGDIDGIKGDTAMSPEHNNNKNSIEQDPPSPSIDPDFAEFCQITENAGFGMMTPFLSDQLKSWMADYSSEWIHQAFDIAIKRNKRSYSYINGILKNMRADGPKEQKRNGTSNRSYAGTDTSRRDHPYWQSETHKRLARTPHTDKYANVQPEDITF